MTAQATHQLDFPEAWRHTRHLVTHRGMTEEQSAVLRVLFQLSGELECTAEGYVVRVHAKVSEVVARVNKYLKRSNTLRTVQRWCKALCERFGLTKRYPGGGRATEFVVPVPDHVAREVQVINEVVTFEDAAKVVEAYPAKSRPATHAGVTMVRRTIAEACIAGADARETYEKMLAGTKAYAQSESVRAGFVYGFRRFLSEGLWGCEHEGTAPTETDDQRRERLRKWRDA